ncbi:unnamed protein product [Brugia timori]|uniref:G_PROTEIN_RECEP_F1_2 domain-containing protein n=1 Tax=Brugia timori TaxID=42155 RepID=A0A0R3QCL9_9BILA|nr:unnamed protein product [Brugia timori]
MDTFLFIATLQFAFLLSVNRFNKAEISAITAANFNYCTAMYSISDLRWYRNCTVGSKDGGELFIKFYHFWTASLPIAVFVIYIAIFCGIRHNRSFSLHNQNKS